MKPLLILNSLLGFLLAGSPVVAGDVSHVSTGSQTTAEARRVSPAQPPASATDAASATTSTASRTSVTTSTNTLPPLPPGVTDLQFSDFFRRPLGPRGLEYSDELRRLEGRRIRILGYMVRQDWSGNHCFLLSPVPQTLHEEEYGLADDLPAAALHVFTSADAPAQTPFTPGLLLLTGELSLGNRLEADGRTSTVRLYLDPPTPDQLLAAEQAVAAAAERIRVRRPAAHAGHDH